MFETCGNDETHAIYQFQETNNLFRQLSFLETVTFSALNTDQKYVSHLLVKAFNFHAITCLHEEAGDYRSGLTEVYVRDNTTDEVLFTPPRTARVQRLMDIFVEQTNSLLNNENHSFTPVQLASRALWAINHVHPFINGNGRTVRAVCYFVLCLKYGQWLPGEPILPILISQNRERYVECLQIADRDRNFNPLSSFLGDLLKIQLKL